VLEYDGGRFLGWQIQARGETVQGALEGAFEKLLGRPVRVIGAGRTDSGVHAIGQVAHCDVPRDAMREGWAKALNAVVSSGVAILRAEPAPDRFHARHDARSKRYRYRILNRRAPSPLRAGQTWHVIRRLDLGAMREAAGAWLGDHDFAAFRGTPGGPPADERTRRTLDRLDVMRTRDEVHVVAEGRSFLRYMVRNLTGTLVEIGLGQRPVAEAGEILESCSRARAGRTAPAHGLCLEAIEYAPASQGDLPSPGCDDGGQASAPEGESSLDPARPVG